MKYLAYVIPDEPHILKPRYWTKSLYEYTPGNLRAQATKSPYVELRKVRRRGLRSYWDFYEGGDLADMIRAFSEKAEGEEGGGIK